MRKLDDRVGLGWRPELAAGILANADRIDVVEVIADDHFEDSRRQLRALRTLGSQIPLVLHGVSLGLASTERVDRRRLDRLARVVDEVQPEFWSEHLAFVRGGGLEIGHLAAPPRCGATVEGLAANVRAARQLVGTTPLLENIATLLEAPGSDQDEACWTAAALEASAADLLLDLHNLHANATNFGFDATAFLDTIPVERVRAIHLAGGRLIHGRDGAVRLLDDHQHAVPDPVFELLREAARRSTRALTVVLERDGRFPPIGDLLAELDRARDALRAGRRDPRDARAKARIESVGASGSGIPEAALALLYVDERARELLQTDPRTAARELGLSVAQMAALGRIDRSGLALAADSYARKREQGRRA